MEAPGGIGRNADGWSGHGGGEAEGQWIIIHTQIISERYMRGRGCRRPVDIYIDMYMYIEIDTMTVADF